MILVDESLTLLSLSSLHLLSFVSYLCVQEDDSLLCDEEINPWALVTSPLLDLLRLGSEHITSDNTNVHNYSMYILLIYLTNTEKTKYKFKVSKLEI